MKDFSGGLNYATTSNWNQFPQKVIPKLKDIQINQDITHQLSKAYSFENLVLD